MNILASKAHRSASGRGAIRRNHETNARPSRLCSGLGLRFSASLRSNAAPRAAAVDAALAAQKAAFLALPEGTRKAAQDALVWLGFYNGVNDGDFGKRTRDAILAFQGNVKAPADGALSAPELKALLAAAQKARDAAGFQIVSDPKSGARIGAPLKLMNARAGARLDFASSADADLGALYARLSAATPTRKIVYKAIKPDAFFVVSGQDGATMFYTRFDKNAAANPPIRGFTFAYPAVAGGSAQPGRDRGRQFVRAVPRGRRSAGRERVRQRRNSAPTSGAGRPRPFPQPAATALVIAPGKALTALKADDCPNPTVAGKPVRIERADAATGLAMIAGDFASKGGSAALRRAGAGPCRPRLRRIAPRGKLGLVRRRRGAAGHHRGGGQERRRRTGVRSKRARWSASWRRSPTSPGASAGVALAAPHAHDRARRGSRLPRRRRTRDRERRPAQRRRHRRARERRARRRLLPEMSAGGTSFSAGLCRGRRIAAARPERRG